jgi:GntR family transcriptional regulator, arabinose operon transcriptional repressor
MRVGVVMLIDRNSPIHLYMQVADSIRQRVASGEFTQGALPSEAELCKLYGVSRFPMRQAMALLVKEGVVSRSRGKGTFASGAAAGGQAAPPARRRTIALVMPKLDSDFTVDILSGFEKAASESGYSVVTAFSGGPDKEAASIERALGAGAQGVIIFPVDESPIDEAFLDGLIGRGVYVSIIDRNPGLDHIDYIGCDNSGGGYLAARHMSLHGFSSAVFVTQRFVVSTVKERFDGFRRGLQQFGIRLLNAPSGVTAGGALEGDAFSHAHLTALLENFRQTGPFAVFAGNDKNAEMVICALRERGLAVGSDVGVIGFDNLSMDEYLSPALTSVAQSGYLIGEAAARLAVQKLESGSKQSVRHILPTQLIARQSCGETRTGTSPGGRQADT